MSQGTRLPAESAMRLGRGGQAYPEAGGRDAPGNSAPPMRGWRILRRHLLLIASCTGALVATTAYFTSRITPKYEAFASIRIEEEEDADSRLGDRRIARPPTPNELPTELEILQSRTLAGAVADSLKLQVELRAPANVSRSGVFSRIQVARDARPGKYRLERRPEGDFSLRDRSTGVSLGRVVPGAPTVIRGAELRLAPAAARYRSIDFDVRSFDDAVEALQGTLAIRRRKRDANIMDVTYRGTDPQLVRDVPNTLATRFMAGLQSERHAKARSTAKFLREQIVKLSTKLRGAEDSLRTFREQKGVVSLPDEASTAVTRAGELEAKRNSIEAERVALAEVVRGIQDSISAHPASAALAYRNLVAFPSLLHDEVMARLITSISAVEDRRSELLSRRSLQDPDVQNLTERVNQLGDQLRAMALTYLRGLTSQVAALDAALAQSRQRLDRIPEKELRFARLQREAKGYEEIVTQLQSRLKEAEIAEAVDDPSVRLVDAAILPTVPVSPKPLLNLSLAFMLGILLGTSGAFLREHMDRTVRTRHDLLVAAGVPILGLLPRARGPGWWRKPFGLGSAGAKRDGGVGGRMIYGSEALALVEGFNRLDTNLAFARPGEPAKVLTVTSPLPGEGKTTVAVNLAVTLAQRGARVVLIDADLRCGMIAAVFGIAQEPGLSDVLLKVVESRNAAHSVQVDETRCLHIISCGRPHGNPAQLLGSAQARTLLRSLREEYDSVIVDTPPANLVADAAVIGAQSDGVIVVARAGVTQGEALAFAMDQLEHVRAPVLGAVLNDIDFRRDAGYDDAYRYYSRGRPLPAPKLTDVGGTVG